jgi:hypothetical protein
MTIGKSVDPRRIADVQLPVGVDVPRLEAIGSLPFAEKVAQQANRVADVDATLAVQVASRRLNAMGARSLSLVATML